jgi:hypothetical protein
MDLSPAGRSPADDKKGQIVDPAMFAKTIFCLQAGARSLN